MIAFVFPGQGSQQKGMGESLFDEFEELTAEADEILGYSIKELCLEDKNQQLGQTQFTQPALFVVNALSYFKKVKETGIKPDYVAGHSLGEYNALLAAEVFDFQTGLKLVKKRGELMGAAIGGGMGAVLGLTAIEIEEVIKKNDLNMIDVANFNTSKQIVLSALKSDIENVKPYFESAGALRYVVLNVSGAFHSRYMTNARNEFEEYIKLFDFSNPKISVISNVYARPYKKSNIQKCIADQINHSVRWEESIRYLIGKGVTEITQIGVGNIVSGMVKTIQRESKPLIMDDEKQTKIIEKDSAQQKKDITNSRNTDSVANNQVVTPNSSLCVEKNNESLDNSAMLLGDEDFKKDYNLKYAYVTGAMYKGVASEELVVKIGNSGCMGFFGTGGLSVNQIENSIRNIKDKLHTNMSYGMNLLYNPNDPQKEEDMIDLFLKHDIKNIEASAFMSITAPLVKFRLKGIKRGKNGEVISDRKIMGKVSRPEVAELFLNPAPERIVEKLLALNKITREEADMSKEIAMVDDLCVEADSGGHTDHGVAYALLPTILKLRDDIMKSKKYRTKIRVGAAGGIGTSEAAAAAFILGADFIMTGSINQCTVEAGTSDIVKDLLQQMNVQDTEYTPAGDMFETGAKVQVLKKGLFFPARANKLYDLYRYYDSIDDIDEKTRTQIQEKYFKRSFEEVYKEVKAFYPASEIEKAERNPKYKMALIFRWYFGYSTQIALAGKAELKVDFQIHCGPALGAYNQKVKGTPYESWKNRHVDEIGIKLMESTADYLNNRFKALNIK